MLDSYIGPYTSIGADVRIEGAEVERSIILPGASIMHIGGRLVGSVVGRDARVFRDFSLPRALRLNVGDGGEVSCAVAVTRGPAEAQPPRGTVAI